MGFKGAVLGPLSAFTTSMMFFRKSIIQLNDSASSTLKEKAKALLGLAGAAASWAVSDETVNKVQNVLSLSLGSLLFFSSAIELSKTSPKRAIIQGIVGLGCGWGAYREFMSAHSLQPNVTEN